MTQPSVPFDLPPDDDLPGPAPEVLDASEKKRVPPKGGGRGGQQETKREVSTNGAPKPANKTLIDFAHENTKNPDAWPKNADALWPLILDHYAADGVGPENLDVHVYRMPLGQHVPDKDKVKIGVIRGDSIKPFGGMSASESQFFYILNTFHCIPAPGCGGDARYELEYRTTFGTAIKTGYLELDSYVTLKAIAERTNEIGAEISRSMQAEQSGQPARPPPIMSMPGQAQPYAPQQPQFSGMPQEMAIEWGVMKERERVRAEQEKRPPRDVPPPASMPDNGAAIAWEREKATMQLAAAQATNTLELKIREMEMKFASDAAARKEEALLNRLAAMEHRMNNPAESDEAKMLKQLIALGLVQVGADGKPVPVGAGASYVPPGKASTPEQQLMEAARVIAEGQEGWRTDARGTAQDVQLREPLDGDRQGGLRPRRRPTWFDKVLAVGGSILEEAR